MEQSYKKYMQRCIDLARNGLGNVAPNPMVGSVIVYNGTIIGEGFHRNYGGAHAEVNAINSVKEKGLLPESTLFVSLEPCAHLGKTPPCSDLIIEKRIKKVVIGTTDPNSVVAGKGIKKLQGAGVEVIVGVLADECYKLNKRFFTFHLHKRPYIILKWAQSGDGFIDIHRAPGTPVGPYWISTPVSRMLVHKWRSVEQAILAGTNTIVYDNPSLDTRLWSGKSPIRAVLDRKGRIPAQATVLNGKVPTLVFTEKTIENSPNVEYIKAYFNRDIIGQVLSVFYERGIQSVLVEGGARLTGSFIESGLWDEARVFTGNTNFGSGVKAPCIPQSPDVTTKILSDTLSVYRNIENKPLNAGAETGNILSLPHL
ncbi:MAG: bifunctional diaminohydroxyphosphoribosylaminopyrimidine deaminase/5-amino-6-(5-phosphoribosylamino)uracil reductase RibD [Bacteroidales bacterium]|nr:bifunctional diaminohydroxyphosphoribosylaminopyrimidine deaminase/5-amino-6-(5-phosphoribosylamino)uracil reductase RibD [Bacteroidales bacterium]